MEEQTTWKGHSFTLLVFTGIVVLCSIFFILGMLVGRHAGAENRERRHCRSRATKTDATPSPSEEKPELTFLRVRWRKRNSRRSSRRPIRQRPGQPAKPSPAAPADSDQFPDCER